MKLIALMIAVCSMSALADGAKTPVVPQVEPPATVASATPPVQPPAQVRANLAQWRKEQQEKLSLAQIIKE